MVRRAKANLPRGSLKYLFVYFKIRIFKCSYRTYIYIYTHVHIYTCTYIHMYIYIYICTYIYICMYVCMHVYIYVWCYKSQLHIRGTKTYQPDDAAVCPGWCTTMTPQPLQRRPSASWVYRSGKGRPGRVVPRPGFCTGGFQLVMG